MTIRHGKISGSDDGGAIRNFGTLTLTNTTVGNNMTADDGGGIFNSGGTLILTNATVNNNKTVDDGGGRAGGGIFNTNGAEAMRIATNGDVGIGTPSPAGHLDISAEVSSTTTRA